MNDHEKGLYKIFRATNWWNKHPWLPVLVTGLWAATWIALVLKLEIESFTMRQSSGLVGMFTFSILVLMLGLAILKHFTHDLQWWKFQKQHRIHEDFTTNIGNVVFIDE